MTQARQAFQYRAEIDGLRAIAVLSVIFFHAGLQQLSGGFLGVDVFFVISGYLITSILVMDISNNQYSILKFYERRARRILPALFFVIALTIPVAMQIMSTTEKTHFFSSMLSVGLFYSNIFFWQNTDYFSPAAEEIPLLHTWSLAIEEQYYILFPILLAAIWKFGLKKTTAIIFGLFVCSLLLAISWNERDPSMGFYLLPFRAWELMAGALVAIVRPKLLEQALWQRMSAGLSTLGILLVGFGLLAYDLIDMNPVFYTFIVIAGTSLIICFGDKSQATGRILASRPMVFIGLLSYSLYLWHQPALAFYRISNLENSPLNLSLVLLFVLIISWVTWKFVETPFRKTRLQQKAIFGISTAGILACSAFAVIAKPTPPLEIQDAELSSCADYKLETGLCFDKGEGDQLVVFWGDSHTGALRHKLSPPTGYRFKFVIHAGCPAVIGVKRQDDTNGKIQTNSKDNSRNCDEDGELLEKARYIESVKPDSIVLASRWTLYIHGWHIKGRAMAPSHNIVSEKPAAGETSAQALSAGLLRTVDELHRQLPDTQLFVMEQVPDLQAYGNPEKFRKYIGLSVPRAEINDWHKEEIQLLHKLQSSPGVQVIWTKDGFCDQQVCTAGDADTLYYADDNHLSKAGIDKLQPLIYQALGMH